MYVIWHVLDISSCTVHMEFPSQYSALKLHWTIDMYAWHKCIYSISKFMHAIASLYKLAFFIQKQIDCKNSVIFYSILGIAMHANNMLKEEKSDKLVRKM